MISQALFLGLHFMKSAFGRLAVLFSLLQLVGLAIALLAVAFSAAFAVLALRLAQERLHLLGLRFRFFRRSNLLSKFLSVVLPVLRLDARGNMRYAQRALPKDFLALQMS